MSLIGRLFGLLVPRLRTPGQPPEDGAALYMSTGSKRLRYLDFAGTDRGLVDTSHVGAQSGVAPMPVVAAAAPTVNDDAGDGYLVGQGWIDTATDTPYTCADNTAGAAVWHSSPAASAFLDAVVYGTGRDGDLVCDGSAAIVIGGSTITPSGGVYTLDRDLIATNLTLSGDAIIAPAGHSIHVSGTLTLSSGTSIIRDDGKPGSGTSAGAALASTSATTGRFSGAGGAGRATTGSGSNGTGVSNSSAGSGGAGGTGGSNAGGLAGAATMPSTTGRGFNATVGLLFGVGSIGGGSPAWQELGCGGGGGGGGVTTSGTSGGGGSGGGMVLVHARRIVITSGSLTLRALGGAGANAASGNAGGGGGGGGGYVRLVTESVSGTAPTLSVAGGAGGTGTGTGATGATGSTGLIQRFTGATQAAA